jgi:hypothetical protein
LAVIEKPSSIRQPSGAYTTSTLKIRTCGVGEKMVLFSKFRQMPCSSQRMKNSQTKETKHVLETTHAHVESVKLLLLLMQHTKLRDI